MDKFQSSASSIKLVLKIRFFLSIVLNDAFSVFCEYLLDSGTSQQQFIYRGLCLFSGTAESSEN